MVALDWRLYEAGYCTHPERATRQGAPAQACEFPALVALLRHPTNGWILFDTGYSEHFLQATAALPERLYRMVTPVHLSPQASLAAQLRRDSIAPEDIAWIVVSHLHGDHIGGLADFPQARAACSREAWDDLQARSRLGALRIGLLPALLNQWKVTSPQWFEGLASAVLPAPLAAFGAGRDLFGDGSLLLVPLPGHAAGHYGALFDDGQGPVFLVADASWSSRAIRDNTPPPTLVTAWLGSTRAYRDTLSRLHALHRAAPQVRLVPSHCPEWRPGPQA
ncbi:MBL fold metallo-hydrolase [Stenotrophomonas sp. DR009]|uniref:MBL fold metallo-hydrolase n=1 Tax=Stenotrophomonas sp. DR009 TaxID=3398461 RepID=UPI003BB214A4